jgi:hypothetical protein
VLTPFASDGATITLSTFDAAFDPGVATQGWWRADPAVSNNDSNDNHIVGVDYRNFFTFDLSGVEETIVSATLLLQRGTSGPSNESNEILEFFDVSTAVDVLNANDGVSPAIFEDLGTGASYGAFSVAGHGSSLAVLRLGLGAAAIGDLNAARGGFFSLGGRLVSAEGNDFLFGSTQGVGQSLELVTVPEPSTGLLIATGLIGLALQRRGTAHSRQGAFRTTAAA